MNQLTTNNQARKQLTVMSNQYGRFQESFNQYLVSTSQTVNPSSVRAFMDSLEDMSASTQRLAKTAIKQSLEESTLDAVSLLLIDREFKRIKTKKPDKKITSYLTKKQIEFIKSKTTDKTRLIIDCLATSGLRVSELLSIKLKDIDYQDGFCQIKITGKGLKIRTVYMSITLIDEVRKVYNSNVYLFENKEKPLARRDVGTVFARLSKKTLIKFSPHSFRHSYATRQIVEKKETLKSVSNYLGHSTTAITADMYVHDSLTPMNAILI